MRINEIKWGDDSAEKDPCLLNYFVASDSFRRLHEKSKSIVIGRKGSGKSALRKKLEETFSKEDNTYVINISPKYSSIKIVLNDKDIISNFGEEIFFQHTWLRQILFDCLCKIGDSAKGTYAQDSLEFARKVSLDMNRTSKDLVENISEILSRVKVKAGKLGDLGLKLEKELREVADVEASEFHLKALAKSGARFVILVDDLDLGWDNSNTANNLLLGLLSATNYLSSLASSNIYCCVFLREDVYSILMRLTQHSDKYRDIERIRWTKNDLIKVINERINFNRVQNGEKVHSNPFHTVFPLTVGASNTDNWLVERTLSRPRELIQLARYYSESVDQEKPDAEKLKESEVSYSSWKLDDLCTEYSNQYSGLIDVFSYWKTKFFRRKYHLTKEEIEHMFLQIIYEVPLDTMWFSNIVKASDLGKFLRVLYDIGFIGDFILGGEGGSRAFYSYDEPHEPVFNEVQIHPCFRKAVNTVDRIKRKTDESL